MPELVAWIVAIGLGALGAGVLLAGLGIALHGVVIVPQPVAQEALDTATTVVKDLQIKLSASIGQLAESTNRVLIASEKTATEMGKIPQAFDGVMISNYVLIGFFVLFLTVLTFAVLKFLRWQSGLQERRLKLDEAAEKHRQEYHTDLIAVLKPKKRTRRTTRAKKKNE